MLKLIDALGKPCPMPVILAKQAIAGGENAFRIQVDNRTAVENLKRLAGSQGFTTALQAEDGTFTMEFTRSDGACGAPGVCTACDDAMDAPLPASSRHYAVFVGRDILGSGDRELGANLMRMFFYTLAQSDDPPQSVLFLNAGVKLPALDAQVAEHLTALQAKGVQVLVCGTCLNFYGIADQLRVGTVSNMYHIVSAMQTVPKVITV